MSKVMPSTKNALAPATRRIRNAVLGLTSRALRWFDDGAPVTGDWGLTRVYAWRRRRCKWGCRRGSAPPHPSPSPPRTGEWERPAQTDRLEGHDQAAARFAY